MPFEEEELHPVWCDKNGKQLQACQGSRSVLAAMTVFFCSVFSEDDNISSLKDMQRPALNGFLYFYFLVKGCGTLQSIVAGHGHAHEI